MTTPLTHLLTIKALSVAQIQQILSAAEKFLDNNRLLPHYPALLKDQVVVNLFYENSTRTRCSFELAAKYLHATVLNVHAASSSITKGESLLDTVANIHAMGAKCFVIRHPDGDAVDAISQHFNNDIHIINGGCGMTGHPSQALLDVFTIKHYKKDFTTLSVAMIGDLRHSRVARADVAALTALGVKDIRLIAPDVLMAPDLTGPNITHHHDIASGIAAADVVISLRIQRERMTQSSRDHAEDFHQHTTLNADNLKRAKKDALVMHPGPMNRNIEITSEVADGSRSVILQQVTFGIAVRMAILQILLGCTTNQ